MAEILLGHPRIMKQLDMMELDAFMARKPDKLALTQHLLPEHVGNGA